ncbi:hypothetical protein ACFOEX_04470 [Camelimonas abortus]|uniref:Uncharacterized protein n=1 Tax=Camelimonas abortus TaxID=1017184 RepID=A0ABV7LE17_9HYPH
MPFLPHLVLAAGLLAQPVEPAGARQSRPPSQDLRDYCMDAARLYCGYDWDAQRLAACIDREYHRCLRVLARSPVLALPPAPLAEEP